MQKNIAENTSGLCLCFEIIDIRIRYSVKTTTLNLDNLLNPLNICSKKFPEHNTYTIIATFSHRKKRRSYFFFDSFHCAHQRNVPMGSDDRTDQRNYHINYSAKLAVVGKFYTWSSISASPFGLSRRPPWCAEVAGRSDCSASLALRFASRCRRLRPGKLAEWCPDRWTMCGRENSSWTQIGCHRWSE